MKATYESVLAFILPCSVFFLGVLDFLAGRQDDLLLYMTSGHPIAVTMAVMFGDTMSPNNRCTGIVCELSSGR